MRKLVCVIQHVISVVFVLIQPKAVASFQPQTCVGGRLKSFRQPSSIILNSSQSREGFRDLESASQSYVTFNHPKTNTEVTLVGCLHGSSSSAKDVSQLLNQATTDVVVLELCPTRYKDLMKEIDRRKTNEMKSNGSYIKMVQRTVEARGVSTGIAAAVLGGASGISTFLSGFDPGLEFITAMEYVEDKSRERDEKGCDVDVILADQMVDETLRRFGSLPSISFDMFQAYLGSGFNWKHTYGEDAAVLANAVSGGGDFQVDMRKALIRNKAVVLDLVRLTLPTFLFIESVNILLGSMFDDFAKMDAVDSNSLDFDLGTIMVDLASTMTSSDWCALAGDITFEILSSCLVLFLGYILVAVPTSKIILSERDNQLAKGIDDACKFASTKLLDRGESDCGRVVCVLGFLHVNGVAKKLLQQS